jgi:hypothetical protein
MPYSKYNLYYKNKTRKPRMTEYRGNPNNRRPNTHSFKLISFNSLNDSIKNFVDHSTDFASQSIQQTANQLSKHKGRQANANKVR